MITKNGTQGSLVFEPINKYFKVITNTDYLSSWKSKELSDESTKPSTTSNNSLTPALSYSGTKTSVKFTGSCLKQSCNKKLFIWCSYCNLKC